MKVSALHKISLIILLIFLCVLSAGCLEIANPTPDHASVRGNIIYLDPNYMDTTFIWSLLTNPNDYQATLISEIDVWLKPERPVIELGAGIGVVSAYVNERLLLPAQQVSVEPNPYLLPSLQKTRNENQMSFTIVPKAIGYGGSENVTMSVGSAILHNRIVEASAFVNTVEVPATTVEKVAQDAGFRDNITLIMTVVGYEHEVIQHESQFMQNSVGTVIAAVYTDGRNSPDTFASRMNHLGFEEKIRITEARENYVVMVFEKIVVPAEINDAENNAPAGT